ncbi:hypothetical protein AVEN_52934-1 [Araneus ventricosus]|uniref:Reverse transcriptase RNase H-like domain-containing protein n=1 Tax=Araneus ventricosus TaxID=182803 RepID=A0A4Y2FED5_ARAVE|nr:hypothetical protein AVEN_52934-1 [Araneus ventricosus]
MLVMKELEPRFLRKENWKRGTCHRLLQHELVERKKLLCQAQRNKAIVKSIEHFHRCLYERKFLLRTDLPSLKWLLNFMENEIQIPRWIRRLQEYDFEIHHRKRNSHGNADALSRRSCKDICKYFTSAEKKF